MAYRGDRGGGRGDRGAFRGGDRGGGDRGGRGGGRGADRGGDRGGDRGAYRGGGGDRGTYRGGGGGDGGFRGGDRGGRGGRGGGFGGPPAPALGFAYPQSSEIDSRLSGPEQDVLVNRFKSLTVQDTAAISFPLRPGWGTSGTPIKLRANFFAMKTFPDTLYEYDVKISPDPKARRLKKRILDLLLLTPEFVAYSKFVAHDSGAKLIAARAIQLSNPEINVLFVDEDEDEAKEGAKAYKVTVNFTQEVDVASLKFYLEGHPNYRTFDVAPAIGALNIILAKYPQLNGTPVGRNKTFFGFDRGDLRGGLEARKGFYTSVRPTFRSLMVNLNVCTTAFYKEGNLANAMLEADRGGMSRLNGFVKGLRVYTTHLPYKTKKSVKRVMGQGASQTEFMCAEYGQKLTVQAYFRRKYKIELRHPNIPLVDIGTKERPNLMPPELCVILPDQAFRGKLSDEHTAAMIIHACKPPQTNAQSIVTQGLPSLGFADNTEPLGQFGIQMSTAMAVVPGRILPPPNVNYRAGGNSPNVREGAAWNLQGVKFLIGAEIKAPDTWAALVIRDGGRDDLEQGDELNGILRGFADMCNKSGMGLPFSLLQAPKFVDLPPKAFHDQTRRTAVEKIATTIRSFSPKPRAILIFLSSGDKSIYSGIKHVCDTKLDVTTVCVQSQKIRKERGQPQYFANVALKLNMKLNGINHTLDNESLRWLKEKPTMLIGSDVTHPSPGSVRGTPSIAAVVGSTDINFGQYPASLRLQESKKEMITDLADMVFERIKAFEGKNRILPARILFFRDGVSEGQFLQVTSDELPKIRAACDKFSVPGRSYRPLLTIAIAGKRHHTRFYPVDDAGADKTGNPKAGTCVDRGVTSPYDFDYFLQAHGGLQGTTRPTHYSVVHDDNKFTADVLQRLTNNACYLFARATRAVSLVPPAYYADLACERGRCYLYDLLVGDSSGSASSGTEQEVFEKARAAWGKGVGNILAKTMFYL